MRSYGMEFSPNLDSGKDASKTGGYGNYYEEVTTHQHAYTVLNAISEKEDFDFPDDLSTDDSVLSAIEEEIESEQTIRDSVENIELVVEDAVDLDYIDHRRTPTGIHCMDYCMDAPGIQLPGGELWTRVANKLMHPTAGIQSLPEVIQEVSQQIQADGVVSPVHNHCAAAANIVPALAINERYMGQARDEFTVPILKDLDLAYSKTDQDIDAAILVGARQAERGKHLLEDLDPDNEDGTKLAISMGLPYEELDKSGRIVAGGLAIFTTTNRFNNQLFGHNHKTVVKDEDKEVRLYAVTLGAYRDSLAARGLKELKIAREIMGAALFTHGLAAHLGGDYLRARVVAPMDNARLSIWQPKK